jgi:hypothetical protein
MKEFLKKSIKTFALFAIIGLLFFPTETFSQGPPPWAPAHGYRAKTRHIYFPEHNFYYDVQKKNYIYLKGKNWTISIALPSIFVGINLGKATQIELDYVGNTPYIYNETHKVKYKKVKVKKAVVKKKVVIKSNKGHGHGHGHDKKK